MFRNRRRPSTADRDRGRTTATGSTVVSSDGEPLQLPWLPEALTVQVAGRGEFFIRRHLHRDRSVPTLLLLHGWTASADLQYFTAYEALAERYSFIAIDHRGHGRGLRTEQAFRLEDAADDAAAVLHQLGVGPVIAVGYSMGGPIAMLLARRHPDLVEGLVVQATALEWRATPTDRLSWMWLPVLGAILRSWAYPRYLRRMIARLIPPGHPVEEYLGWMSAEMRRGDPQAIVEAGRALKEYDARAWAGELAVPAAMLLTTRDRLVRPRKQRALAAALSANVIEFDADHLGTLAEPVVYARLIVEVVEALVGQRRSQPAATSTNVSA